MNKVYVIVEGGCVRTVLSTSGDIKCSIIDCDGDDLRADEQRSYAEGLFKSKKLCEIA